MFSLQQPEREMAMICATTRRVAWPHHWCVTYPALYAPSPRDILSTLYEHHFDAHLPMRVTLCPASPMKNKCNTRTHPRSSTKRQYVDSALIVPVQHCTPTEKGENQTTNFVWAEAHFLFARFAKIIRLDKCLQILCKILRKGQIIGVTDKLSDIPS